MLEFIDRVWNARELDKVNDFSIRDLFLHDIGHRTWVRPEGYKRSLLQLLARFRWRPSRSATCSNYDERYAGLRVAVMWKLVGDYIGVPDSGRSPVSAPNFSGSPSSWSNAAGSSRSTGLRPDRAAGADQRGSRRTALSQPQHLLTSRIY